jgi:hypothetical protein
LVGTRSTRVGQSFLACALPDDGLVSASGLTALAVACAPVALCYIAKLPPQLSMTQLSMYARGSRRNSYQRRGEAQRADGSSCDRGTVALDRVERRLGGRRRPREGTKRKRLQRRERAVRRPDEGRHRRSDEGRALGEQNAASVASLVLTAEALITEKPAQKSMSAPGGFRY